MLYLYVADTQLNLEGSAPKNTRILQFNVGDYPYNKSIIARKAWLAMKMMEVEMTMLSLLGTKMPRSEEPSDMFKLMGIN